MLRLLTFGGCAITRDGQRLDDWQSQQRALALLALLAAEPGGVSRAILTSYLWPERDEERARDSLRQLVLAVRRRTGADVITGTVTLGLNAALIESDIAEFRAAAAAGDVSTVVALHTGPFLQGFSLRGAGEFERWASGVRSTCADSTRQALLQLAQSADRRGDPAAAVSWWKRLAAEDPLGTTPVIGLMRALDASGERAAALRQARIYAELLRAELGTSPDSAVTAVVDELSRGAGPRAPSQRAQAQHASPPHSAEREVRPAEPAHASASAAAAATGAIPEATSSVALLGTRTRAWLPALAACVVLGALTWSVLRGNTSNAERSMVTPATVAVKGTAPLLVVPFANQSGDRDDDPLVDGLTDEIITAIGRRAPLRVIGRTSAFTLKERSTEVRSTASQLGVESVLEGSWRRDGSRVRILARLVAVRTGVVQWATSMDYPANDLAGQEAIAGDIADSVHMQLAGGEMPGEQVIARQASSLVYERYLRGRHAFHNRIDPEGVRLSARSFADAIARDSMFAPAHAGLSDAYARLAVFGYDPPHPLLARARAAAERAVALDSASAEAHVALGHALFAGAYAWDAAEQEFRRANALNPRYAFGRAPFAVLLMARGRHEEALAQLDSAQAIEPLAPWVANVRGRVLVSAGRAEEAVAVLSPALELYPALDLAHQQLGRAYLQLDDTARALASFRRTAALHGARDSAHLAYALAVTGRQDTARAMVAALSARDTLAMNAPYVAMVYAALGDKEAAFNSLRRGCALRMPSMVGVAAEPALRPLHGDAQWHALLRDMGFDNVPAAAAGAHPTSRRCDG